MLFSFTLPLLNLLYSWGQRN